MCQHVYEGDEDRDVDTANVSMCQNVYEGDEDMDVDTVNVSMCQHVHESVRRIETGGGGELETKLDRYIN